MPDTTRSRLARRAPRRSRCSRSRSACRRPRRRVRPDLLEPQRPAQRERVPDGAGFGLGRDDRHLAERRERRAPAPEDPERNSRRHWSRESCASDQRFYQVIRDVRSRARALERAAPSLAARRWSLAAARCSAADASAPPTQARTDEHHRHVHGICASDRSRSPSARPAARSSSRTRGAVGAVDVRGGAPGTRETDLLAPDNTVERRQRDRARRRQRVRPRRGRRRDAIPERDRASAIAPAAGPVPIVPAAILYDLTIGGRPDVRPDAACGYDGRAAATTGAIEEGSVGAGAGATVGKMLGGGRAMKGGIGTASLTHDRRTGRRRDRRRERRRARSSIRGPARPSPACARPTAAASRIRSRSSAAASCRRRPRARTRRSAWSPPTRA